MTDPDRRYTAARLEFVVARGGATARVETGTLVHDEEALTGAFTTVLPPEVVTPEQLAQAFAGRRGRRQPVLVWRRTDDRRVTVELWAHLADGDVPLATLPQLVRASRANGKLARIALDIHADVHDRNCVRQPGRGATCCYPRGCWLRTTPIVARHAIPLLNIVFPAVTEGRLPAALTHLKAHRQLDRLAVEEITVPIAYVDRGRSVVTASAIFSGSA